MQRIIYSVFSLLTLASGYAVGAEGDEPVSMPPDNGFWQTLVMIGIAFLFFYIILWRPEQKRRQALEAQRSALKKGDRVAAVGIIGEIVRIDDQSQTVILKMYDGSKIEVYKAAITDVLLDADDAGKKADLSVDENGSRK